VFNLIKILWIQQYNCSLVMFFSIFVEKIHTTP